MTRVFNTKMTKASNFNNEFKTMNYQDHLKYTKGYFQFKCCCDNQKNLVTSANQGKISYIDLKRVVKKKYYGRRCKFKDYNYIIDNCRHSKGLITPRGKIKIKQRNFSYPTPLKKLYCHLPESSIEIFILFLYCMELFEIILKLCVQLLF